MERSGEVQTAARCKLRRGANSFSSHSYLLLLELVGPDHDCVAVGGHGLVDDLVVAGRVVCEAYGGDLVVGLNAEDSGDIVDHLVVEVESKRKGAGLSGRESAGDGAGDGTGELTGEHDCVILDGGGRGGGRGGGISV